LGVAPPTRFLQSSSDVPLVKLELFDVLSLSFDFNFANGKKHILWGLQFHYSPKDAIAEL
jgi:hypothetical protein